ncbi:MAG: IS66 family transposase [Burkholderiales bacterium]
MSRRRDKPPPRVAPPAQELNLPELAAIVERARGALSSEEHAKLKVAMETLAATLHIVAQMSAELHAKNASIGRLRRMLFGATTERLEAVLGEPAGDLEADRTAAAPAEKASRPKPVGHGRNGAAAYTGAERISVAHAALHREDACPACQRGKVYPLAPPAMLVRITGMAPLAARVYECDRLRCNLCGEVYTAAAPEAVGNEKYDASASTMVGLLKYGTGLPFNRIERLQKAMGIPLPAATQWDLVKSAANTLAPAHEELIREAAQGAVLHNDDTTMKVLQLTASERAAALASHAAEQRTGVFTSGIVATGAGHKVALFFTGVRHAGENLAAVLARRAAQLPAPIQMCDGLPSNTAGDFETLLSNCLAHARRKCVEVAAHFPEEVRFVLETLREVYKTDAQARRAGLDPEARLRLHQAQSGPPMAALEQWMQRQFAAHLVEPNSGLGEAIGYMQKRWGALTLFLRVPGVPLDNNITEQALKKVILHRKNALFYKTLNGARVGDIFMSLIYTAELNRIDPFDYLVTLQRHAEQLAAQPADWMPWNYQSAPLARASSGPDPPA